MATKLLFFHGSPGASVKIILTKTEFDPWAEIKTFQTNSPHIRGKHGATATFVGTMRDFNEGDTVTMMTLEYYPGMTEKHLEKIVAEAEKQWNFLDCLVVHRVGDILPNDPIVLVSVWSSHRGAAFDACRFIMEQLKSKAPFWKKEHTENSVRWVAKNSSGYEGAK